MTPLEWSTLASPLPPDALVWLPAEIGADGLTVRLEPHWELGLIRARLDAAVGVAGWSHALAPAGGCGLVSVLTVAGVSRSAVAAGQRAGAASALPLEAVGRLAFARAAREFGMAPAFAAADESYWVDYDPDAVTPLYEPEGVPLGQGSPVITDRAQDEAYGSGGFEVADGGPAEATPEARAMLERLMDRLRDEGLGREAARLVATHHGDSTEDARALYGKLRSLLLAKSAGG